MWRQLLRIWSSPRIVLRRVLALDDTPHAVALGATIGMLFGLTPTVGLQTVEVILFALFTRRLFYFNRAAALTVIYISNPLTVAPIYYGLYWVGSWFVPGQATLQQFQEILTFEGFAGWWQALTNLATDVGLPLLVGTLVIAPLGAVLTYPVTRALLQWYRGKRPPSDRPSGSSQAAPVRRPVEETTAEEPDSESTRTTVDPPHTRIQRPSPMAPAPHSTLEMPASS